MKVKNKVYLASFICIGAGAVLLILGLLLGGRPGFYIDKSGIHTANESGADSPYIQEKMKLDEFSTIDITIQYADLEIIPSDGYYIEYRLDGSEPKPALEVKNQKLSFKERTAGGFIGFNFFSIGDIDAALSHYYVTLYVPAEKYFTKIRLENNDGDIRAEQLKAETMEITNDYGQVDLGNVQGEKLKINMDDGTLKIKSLDAAAAILYNEYGKCELGTVKSQRLEAELDDGDFSADRCSAKAIRIDNEYGNVRLGLLGKTETYEFELETEYGNIELPGYPEMSVGGNDEKRIRTNNSAKNKIVVNCDDGDIMITRAE